MSFFKKLRTDIETEDKPVFPKKKDIKVEGSKKPEPPKKKIDPPKPKKNAQDWLKSEGQLAVDVFHTATEFCIQAPIAGVMPEDIDVDVENEMLIIKGERREPDIGKEKDYFYQECYWGPFSRQIILPEDADSSKIKASLKKGILVIKIPRASKIKKRKVNISLAE